MSKYCGLSNREANQLLLKNGRNCLREEKKKTIFEMFLLQLINFTNLILAIAIVVSLVLGDYAEAIIVGVIVIANAIIGVIQEGKAQKALDALKKLSVLKANVIRDGVTQEISSEELVVGDIVTLEAGQFVPADLKLLEAINLKIDEKLLTGESVPTEKDTSYIPTESATVGDRLDLAYMSTTVTYGRGVGEVIKTGMDTEMGKIADLVGKEKERPSPLQKAMDGLSKWLGLAAIIICVIMFIIGIIQGRNFVDMLMTAVSLAVASIPEGIPTIVTIVLALGMQKMAKVNAIVKTLPAIETLGSVNYVCSDKTGTLTQNRMTVVKAYCNGKYLDLKNMDITKNQMLLTGLLLCNDAIVTNDNKEIGDPTETALVTFAKRYNMLKSSQEELTPRINELAFDSDRKIMTTLHKIESGTISYTKGSTDAILDRCTKIMVDGKIMEITENDKQNMMDIMSEMSNDALRVLSLAIKYNNEPLTEDDLIFVGLVGMIDPEREEVKDSIRIFKEAGIKTIMITGDHKDTAFAIGKKLGIASNPMECIMGHEIDSLNDKELTEKIKDISIFARVSPEHKVRIVKALQGNGYIVAMSGDGANDSPSLKAADVGIAMGITGTDVAKGAADIVLQDDSFTTIEKAIREGRNIYSNIKKSIIFAVSSNVGEVITMFAAILMGIAAPLKAVQILWVNLLTDSLPCFALGVDSNKTDDVMKRPPRNTNESVFAGGGIKTIIIYSVIIAILTLGAFIYPALLSRTAPGLQGIINAYSDNNILIQARTYAFCILALSELFYALCMRNQSVSVFKMDIFDNKLMLLSFLVGMVGQIFVTEIPFLCRAFGTDSLNIFEWIVIILISSIPLWVHEIIVAIKGNVKHFKSLR